MAAKGRRGMPSTEPIGNGGKGGGRRCGFEGVGSVFFVVLSFVFFLLLLGLVVCSIGFRAAAVPGLA